MIFGVMLQIAEGDELRRLKEAFECKSEGAISSCRKILK